MNHIWDSGKTRETSSTYNKATMRTNYPFRTLEVKRNIKRMPNSLYNWNEKNFKKHTEDPE